MVQGWFSYFSLVVFYFRSWWISRDNRYIYLVDSGRTPQTCVGLGPLNIPGLEADENLKNAPLAKSFIAIKVFGPQLLSTSRFSRMSASFCHSAANERRWAGKKSRLGRLITISAGDSPPEMTVLRNRRSDCPNLLMSNELDVNDPAISFFMDFTPASATSLDWWKWGFDTPSVTPHSSKNCLNSTEGNWGPPSDQYLIGTPTLMNSSRAALMTFLEVMWASGKKTIWGQPLKESISVYLISHFRWINIIFEMQSLSICLKHSAYIK